MQPHRARPAEDTDKVDGYPQERAVLKQGGGKGLARGLGPCFSFWLSEPWKLKTLLLMLLEEGLGCSDEQGCSFPVQQDLLCSALLPYRQM